MRRNTASLLVIIAALLAADIALRVSPRVAVAQDQFDSEAARAPHVIQVEATTTARVYRLWSDGVIDYATFDSNSACLPDEPPTGRSWQVMPETVALPPGVRITKIYTMGWHFDTVLLRLRSDGVVEQNWRSGTLGWCGWRTPPQ